MESGSSSENFVSCLLGSSFVLPPFYIHILNWEKVWGVKEFLGSSSAPRRLREAWKKRRNPRWILGRLFSVFVAPVSVVDSVLLSRTSLRISVVHKQSFSFSFSSVKE